jgi:hypothetical protein
MPETDAPSAVRRSLGRYRLRYTALRTALRALRLKLRWIASTLRARAD